MVSSSHTDNVVSLRQLFPSARLFGANDIRVNSCASDSRACRRGDLFVALVGSRLDGHDFAANAIARGAAAVLAERPLPNLNVPTCVVPDSAAAFGTLCQALAGNPSRRLKVIGVGGTHGKTTAAMLIASVLARAGARCGALTSLGYCDGERVAPPVGSAPAPPVLASWMLDMLAAGCTHCVVEASADGLARSMLAGVALDAACVTNVCGDQLEHHVLRDRHRRGVARLLRQVSGEGVVVLNADDPGSRDLAGRVDGPMLTIGLRESAEVSASVIERLPSEQTFLLSAGSDTAAVRTRTIGDQHVSECLLAAAVGLAYGIDLPTVVRGLEAVEQLDGQLERIDCGQPFNVFVDGAQTPDSLAAALSTLRDVTAGRLLCVMSVPGEGNRQRRLRLGAIASRGADRTIITSAQATGDSAAGTALQVLDGFADRTRAELVLDRGAAIRRALAHARPGDCVLVAGVSRRPFSAGPSNPIFDDRVAVRRTLYDLQPMPVGVVGRG